MSAPAPAELAVVFAPERLRRVNELLGFADLAAVGLAPAPGPCPGWWLVRVERVVSPRSGRESWTVIGAARRPVALVESYLG